MKLYGLFLVLVGVALVGASCGSSAPSAVVVEYGQVCTDANKDKTIAVEGFLQVAEKVPCLNMLNPRRDCAVKILDKVNVVGNEIIAYLPEGTEPNQMETPESSGAKPEFKKTTVFTREQVKFRAGDGTVVVPQADVATPVTITGKVSLTPDGGKSLCSLMVTKIDKK